MKHLTSVAVLLLVAISLPSCELQTNTPDPPPPSATNHIVINEIFSLPLTNQNTFRWIEFSNPTGQTVDMNGWSLGFTTRKTSIITDTAGNFRNFEIDSVDKYYNVPIRDPIRPGGSLNVRPNEFLIIVNNEDRLENYTVYGPGEGPKLVPGDFIFVLDTVTVDSIRFEQYEFVFRPQDQLILRDTLGNVVDIFRYGGWPVPTPDTLAGGRSIGP
ncbi:MAG: hypothetical protein HW407_2313, partial [Bacteroidetes bacterium]|nr:hypothetical protein [Bacteroidota bacterium]